MVNCENKVHFAYPGYFPSVLELSSTSLCRPARKYNICFLSFSSRDGSLEIAPQIQLTSSSKKKVSLRRASWSPGSLHRIMPAESFGCFPATSLKCGRKPSFRSLAGFAGSYIFHFHVTLVIFGVTTIRRRNNSKKTIGTGCSILREACWTWISFILFDILSFWYATPTLPLSCL